ncbi:M48 family metallopeptidase [Dysgonomonas sp. GY75]|uniref:M48 family metallopeptidase n=1 Tax=Dysgonomonas sp. GY75 TaxID=2780419 RepID=UPI001883AB56|nr:M48 family metallopeptidase [Dysgonomonas sp. GY75]MBF0648724.1 M48 family metallopeptidase [Dysgonomonas sp. GY75]
MKKTNAFGITEKFWDFIEKYLPDYHERDDVLRQSQLQLYIDGKESAVAGEGLAEDEAGDELHHILYNLYAEAIDAYTKGLGEECGNCRTQQGNFCSACGKKLH